MKILSILVWDAGMYDAKILRCEQAESAFPGREGQPRFKWTLRLRDPAGDEYTEIPYYTNTTLSTHAQAKLRPLVRAVLPELDLTDPETARDLDTEDLVGKRCRVVLGVDDEKGRNTVDKILPAEGTGAPKRAAGPDDEDDGTDAPPPRRVGGAGARRGALAEADIPF